MALLIPNLWTDTSCRAGTGSRSPLDKAEFGREAQRGGHGVDLHGDGISLDPHATDFVVNVIDPYAMALSCNIMTQDHHQSSAKRKVRRPTQQDVQAEQPGPEVLE
ncbi:hypothetical protein TESG_04442 [Trichophyton tonsurans CBS 112818]|uniref:Uncharacterized protein n=1 Tax=Trichophyton tonsurans (strain CBS 112818) TaxID=647933 RepID=F2S0C1_TRIT1|nr:hypothetical protein TESG_04442 [Trichophyton tonsurans CBS 112818]